MSYPKFIITQNGHFRLGMVDQHKELLQAGDICYGGGYYEFDYIANELLLHGKSYDFGKPKWNELSTLHIPEVYRGLRLVYQYDSGAKLYLGDHLNIDYYAE